MPGDVPNGGIQAISAPLLMPVALLALGILAGPPKADPPIHVVVAPAETLAVTIAGAGSPVVIIPGMLGGAFGFRKVGARLVAAGHRVIIVTPLGVGASGRPRHADYSLAQQAVRVAAALDTLHIRDAIVVCHSIGAAVGLRLAVRRPDQVAGLISINGGPAEHAGNARLRFALRLAPLLRVFGGKALIRNRVRAGLRSASGDPAWVTSTVVKAYTAPFAAHLHASLAALRHMVDAREPERLAPQLHRIRVPVLLLLGTKNGNHGIKKAEIATLRRDLPRFSVDTVADAGLYIQEERPAAVVRAVARMSGELRAAAGSVAAPGRGGAASPAPGGKAAPARAAPAAAMSSSH